MLSLLIFILIKRKDQINEDKRKVRMLKERYLKDGELHQDKGFRKKQFRWKNLGLFEFKNKI